MTATAREKYLAEAQRFTWQGTRSPTRADERNAAEAWTRLGIMGVPDETKRNEYGRIRDGLPARCLRAFPRIMDHATLRCNRSLGHDGGCGA